jgi:phage gp29-like protein
MAKQKQEALKERPDKLVSRIIKGANARARRDIAQWQTALRAAENVENPKRIQLYNIYNDVMIDADLTSEIEKRKNALLGSTFNLYKEDGSPEPDATMLLQGSWFTKFIEWAFESKLWGHSLIEISVLTTDGKVADVELANRWHVIPEKGIMRINQSDDVGIIYRGNVQYEQWLFEIGDNYNLGLLNKAVPHVLYKRFAQGAWSEFCEIFGVPPRYAKTDARDTESLNRLEDMMVQMGVANYAVINKDEEITFLEPSNQDGTVFSGLMKYSGAQISKLINGAVLGEDSQGGSRSKEEVGLELANGIWTGDKTWLEGVINEKILPKLIALGYPFAGLKFEFNREKNLKDEWAIVNGVCNHFEVEPEYIRDTFGIPVIKQKLNNTSPQIKAKTTDSFFG